MRPSASDVEKRAFPAAAWRILADVVVYRVRKREMANLATSLTLAWALGAGSVALGVRLAFGVVLNLFVYLVNDCFDVAIDLQAPGRDAGRTRFLADHIRAAWITVGLMAVGLCVFGALARGGLLAAAAVNIVVIFAYSKVLKHIAILDLLAMGVWGVSMAMVGFDARDPRGWRLAGLLAFLSMVTESVQVLRDEPSDRAAGVRTSAVVLGVPATAWIARSLVCSAAAYAAVFIHPAGAVLAIGAVVALRPERANRSWDQLRVLFGLTWLALMALVRFAP